MAATTLLAMEGVAFTSLWAAAGRALESEREGGWFHDPFARALAGEEGLEAYAKSHAASPVDVPVVAVRTRWFDERFADARHRGIKQFVILAAGMDARAYRLDALSGVKVFELDRDFVLAHKAARIGGAKPKGDRFEIAIDLREDWPSALRAAGFDPHDRSLWLTEGLLLYLHEPDVKKLIARIDENAAPGSEMLFDLLGRSFFESPWVKETLAVMERMGAPWHFGTEEPEKLFLPRWKLEVLEFSKVGSEYGRWPFPFAPRGTPGVPQSYLVHARTAS
jgi:methyltransferase (TIGR00027 family)